MSTRCYDTDLNDAAWAWIAPYLLAARSGGRPRTTDLRAVLNERVKGRKRHLLVDTLGMVVARRVEAANVSDRRAGARLLAGLQSGFPRASGR